MTGDVDHTPSQAAPAAMIQFDSAGVAAELADIRHDRPKMAFGARSTQMGASVFSGLVSAGLAGILAYAMSGLQAALLLAPIAGLVSAVSVLIRPLRKWRARLTNSGRAVRRLPGGTQVDLWTLDGLHIAYQLKTEDAAAETLVVTFDPPLPASLVIGPNCAPTGDVVFDRILGVEGTDLRRTLVDAPLRIALLAFAGQARLIGGALRITLASDPPSADAIAALVTAVLQLARDIEDPISALRRIVDGRVFDATRARLQLMAHRRKPDAIGQILRRVRSRKVEAIVELELSPKDEVDMLAGVYWSGLATQQLHESIKQYAVALPTDEVGTRRAVGLLHAVRANETSDAIKRLGEIGTLSSAQWLSKHPFEETWTAAATAARTAIYKRVGVDGALSVHVGDAGGALSIGAPDGGGVSLIETEANGR